MLKFSINQIDVLSRGAEESFLQEMIAHATQFSPRLCATLSGQQLKSAVAASIEAAKKAGFQCRGPIRTWIESTILFGAGFHTDPQYPFLGTIVRADADEMRRAHMIFDRMNDFNADVFGDKAVDLHNALAKLLQFCEKPPALKDSELPDQALNVLSQIFPKKAAKLGEGACRALIDSAEQTAAVHGFSSARARMMLISLAFSFGHCFDSDPFVPWLGATLSRSTGSEADERAMLLERKSLIWLRKVVEGNARIAPS